MKHKNALQAALADRAAFHEILNLLEYVEFLRGGAGEVFFVGSASTGAKATASGLRKDDPLTTIQLALNKCSANRGDKIFVLPGHTETVSAAAGLDLDIAGVSIHGFGNGTLKPTITLGTATTADVDIDAANMRLSGFKFVSNIDSLANILDVNAGNFVCEDCDFESSSAKEVLAFVDLATTVDNFTFRRCKFVQPTDPAGTDGGAGTGCFYIVDSENILIDECEFNGAFETAIFHNRTTACVHLTIRNCFGRQLLSGAEVTQLVATATGLVINSSFHLPNAADVSEATVWGTLGVGFGVDVNSGVLADGAAGGQLLAPGSAANS